MLEASRSKAISDSLGMAEMHYCNLFRAQAYILEASLSEAISDTFGMAEMHYCL